MVILACIMVMIMFILAIRMGIEALATDLYNQNRISFVEYDYMRSLEYLWNRIKYIINHLW